MKFTISIIFCLFFITSNNLPEENLTKAINLLNHNKKLTEINSLVKDIETKYGTKKDFEQRALIGAKIELLAIKIESDVLKAQSLISNHYQLLKKDNKYGLANEQCQMATYRIDEKSKLIGHVNYLKSNAIKLQSENFKTVAYGLYFVKSSTKYYKKELNGLLNLLKASLVLQRVDSKRTLSERKRIFSEDKIKGRIDFNKQIEEYDKIVKPQKNTNKINIDTKNRYPTFPGCKGTNNELKNCFEKKINKQINRRFNFNLFKELGLSPGKKIIFYGFKIDKSGNVINIDARAPHPKLKKEIQRVLNLLPRMKPKLDNGKAVESSYSFSWIHTVN